MPPSGIACGLRAHLARRRSRRRTAPAHGCTPLASRIPKRKETCAGKDRVATKAKRMRKLDKPKKRKRSSPWSLRGSAAPKPAKVIRVYPPRPRALPLPWPQAPPRPLPGEPQRPMRSSVSHPSPRVLRRLAGSVGCPPRVPRWPARSVGYRPRKCRRLTPNPPR